MPNIHFECPKCNQQIDAPQELAAQLIDCPACKETIEIPVRSRLKEPPKLPEPEQETPVPPTPAPTPIIVKLPDIESSSVASALTIFAVLEFIGAIIGGLVVGVGDSESVNGGDAELGWMIFLCGVVSGLILLGFARVIEYSFESAQRLRRLEFIILKINQDKNAV